MHLSCYLLLCRVRVNRKLESAAGLALGPRRYNTVEGEDGTLPNCQSSYTQGLAEE